MRRAAYAVLILLACSSAAGGDAVYVMRGEQLPVGVVTNGYLQTVTERGSGEVVVNVATDLGPIGSSGIYASVRRNQSQEVPPGFVLPASLHSKLQPQMSAWDAATRVLIWVIDRVRLDVDDVGPQDAISVLRRRRGRCSGVANLSAALLLAAGFEARTVSGLLITDRGGIPHRWVECRLPGAGWVPTDPTLGLWAITPRHVAFADAVEHAPEVVILDTGSDPLSRLPLQRGLPLRPNEGIELVCRLVEWEDGAIPVATLSGPAGEVFHSRLAPEGRFSGLLPGRWLLEVEQGGQILHRQELILDRGRIHSIALRLPAAADRLGS